MRMVIVFTIAVLLLVVVTVGIQDTEAGTPGIANGEVRIWDLNKKYDYKHYGFTDQWNDRANWTQVPYGTTNSYTFNGDCAIEGENFWISLHSSPHDAVFLYAKVDSDGSPSRHNELYRVWDVDGLRCYGGGASVNKIIKNEPGEVIVESTTIPYDRDAYGKTYHVEITTRYRVLGGKKWFEIIPIEQADEQGFHGESRIVIAPDGNGTGNDALIDSWKYPKDVRVFLPDESKMLLDFIMDADIIWLMTWPTPAHEKGRADNCEGGYPAGWQHIGEGSSPKIFTAAFGFFKGEKIVVGVLYKNFWHYQKIDDYIYAGVPYTGKWKRCYERALPHGSYPVGSPWTPGYPGKWRIVGCVDGQYYTNELVVTDTSDDSFSFTSPVSGTLEYLITYMYDRTADTPGDISTPMDIYREAINPDTTPPVITFKKITVNGSVGDDTVTEVEINGVPVPVTAGKYSYEVDVSSTKTITITATNGKGETVTRIIDVK